MAMFYKKNNPPDFEIGIWDITEPEAWFLERLPLNDAEQKQLANIKGHRRLEWLASRYLMSEMLGAKSGALTKDEFGKPFLAHLPLFISLSHSHGLAAAIIAKPVCGIDIQKLVPKIDRIAHRVLRPEELDSLEAETRMEHLHVYWGAKESLYKAYGRRELDFCTHIQVEPFSFDLERGYCEGRVVKNNYDEAFYIHYQMIGSFVLVYVLKK